MLGLDNFKMCSLQLNPKTATVSNTKALLAPKKKKITKALSMFAKVKKGTI